MKRTLRSLALFATVAALGAGAAVVRGDDPPTRHVAVTVYNDDLGLVRDERRIDLAAGVFTLPFRDVAARIDPTSVAFRALDHAGSVDVLEQNYEYDLLTPQALMEKYVGETVTLIMSVDGKETAVAAKLLSVQNGTVYQIGDSIVLNPPGRVVLPDLKGDLKATPTLVWTLASDRAGDEPVEVSYLTGGLSWKADYVATLAEDDRTMEWGGWVTLNNQSGTTYPNAKLKLVAGDVHRAPREEREFARRALAEAAMAADAATFEERTFFEYHLYDLPRPTTIKHNQTKQIRLMETSRIGTRKRYVLAGSRWYWTQAYGGEKGLKVGVYQEFENTRENGLGAALPAGTVRIYKADADGTLQLVGEDAIDHTPKDETVRLQLGKAFDLVAERRQTDFRVISSGHLWEAAFEVVIRNHKDEDVTVRVIEPLPGDWRVLEKSHAYEKLDAFTVAFDVRVEAGGEATLTYRMQVKH
ncbi:MAG: DUF4139 domain-containing protein [Gemmatimonadetes bacterium]|nr:DUF4139 domain-containing protein [Gemmatimonadota bacterium]